MDTNTIYYWRIDEKNGGGTTTGNLWSFKTVVQLPSQAGNPIPADTANDVGIAQDLSWSAGSGATSHDVYFGTTNPPPFIVNQTGTTYDPGLMDVNTIYYWQIDEKNTSGTTTGILWNFTTGSESDVNDANLIAWWKFDEGTGTKAYDSKGDNDGNLINGPVWTSGQINGGLSFDGVDDYVNVADDTSLRFTKDSNFTICAWVNPNSISHDGGEVLCKMQANSQKGLFTYELFWQQSLQRFVFEFCNSGYYYEVVSTPDSSAPAGSWYHVTCVYQKKDIDVYLNGVFQDNGYFNSNPTGAANHFMSIGVRSYDTSFEGYFGGTLDDISIYNRALTADEVDLLYKQGLIKRAYNPNPVDEEMDVEPNVVLSWSPVVCALSHDVYFGTDFDDVIDADIYDPNIFMGNQDVNYWDINNYDSNGLDYSTTYYWRIDEVNGPSVWKGEVWSFLTTNPPPPVALLGSWLSGDSHIKETGTNRALVFIAHAEDDGSPDINLNSVSYGGQPMTKVIDTVVGTTWRAYVAAFILDESGVNAASGDTFVCSWNHTPDYYLYASAFLQNVNQTTLIGATDSNSITSGNTITAPAMGTIAGDMVVDAATCGNSGSYTFNNSFTEGTDDTMGSTATGAAGYKSATGAYETPSVTHNNANRQVIIGFVVHREQ
ncbi:MAG: LamG domain-containing protein, partial [Sedimentisphaerales bacterium]|nr:LamG domain-containing protein [Sedimentisphaerales bacterium]